MKKITIATRGSNLALWQAEYIKGRLQEKYPDLEVELLVLKTKGDIILDVPLAKVGGKGLFVKEIEEALLDGRADLAVHSMKDVPMDLPEGLVLGVVPMREISSDVLLSEKWSNLRALPENAKIGTSSLRREAQLKAQRPDLEIIPLRGNVETRLKKMQNGEFEAIVMAAAGIKRLKLAAKFQCLLSAPDFLPAAGQGALGIEYVKERHDIADLVRFMDHPASRICVTAERAVLRGLNGGCQVPIAAYGTMRGSDTFILEGLVASQDGKTVIRHRCEFSIKDPESSGLSLANELKKLGADDILKCFY